MSQARGKQKAFREIPPRVDVDELERGILKKWEENDTFERSLEARKGEQQFVFYDGPPYATGKPHYGHILQSSIKDAVLRYKTMRGYYVPRRVGWDTHGLPIETIVEKELGIANKREIEGDIEGFNEKCRQTVFRYVDEFTATLKRLGRWADYEHAYSTLDQSYMESEWWVFSQLWKKDLVYKAFRSTPYCIRCVTPLSNFEVSISYADVTDRVVYVLLAVDAASLPNELQETEQDTFLLVWTTTPWTLPGNVAVAYSPQVTYVIVEHEGKRLIVARDRVRAVFGDEATVVREITSEQLRRLTYAGLYPQQDVPYVLVPGEHVTAEDGTGLVHIAPAFGEEDAQVGKVHDLPVLRTVTEEGRFIETLEGTWAGEHIFESQKKIIKDLAERGLLFRAESYTHSYPHCWRCDTPLIYYALDTWFINIQQLKDALLANNENINWIPEHVKGGRFKKGIEMAPDWAVSRNRFWSVPMPIWECDADSCAERVCVGSVGELTELSGITEIPDLHRPYVDEITWDCLSCGSTMRRIPEVLDVWFDAGSMPFAQWHYPFENKELAEQQYPADFIVEAIEQTRLWFYVLHVLGEAVAGGPAFLNAIGAGIIFAEDGQKLSKRLKNYPDIEPTIQSYGADVLRLYLLSSSALGEPYRFSEKDLQHLYRNVYMTLWNVYSFFVRYANVQGWQAEHVGEGSSSHLLDVWIRARVHQLEVEMTTAMEQYHVDRASRMLAPFISDLSNWYVRRSRSRLQPARSTHDQSDAQAAFATLHEVLVRVATMMAPLMPFLAEEIHDNLLGQDSVHLTDLPEVPSLTDDERTILRTMEFARDVVSAGLAYRAKHGVKVRQPLAKAFILQREEIAEDMDALWGIVRDEINVKEIAFVDEAPGEPMTAGLATVSLELELDRFLVLEGLAREIIRHGQMLRREAGYELDDVIELLFVTEDTDLQEAFAEQQQVILQALQAKGMFEDKKIADAGEEKSIKEHSFYLGVRRIS